MNQKINYTYRYPRPAVTTDCVVYRFDREELQVLLIQRANEPFRGKWAFPGGFLEKEETTRQGALRELSEETGIVPDYLEQFYTFSAIDRDPRERVISVAYIGLVNGVKEPFPGDDAAKARWYPISKLPSLAFDHAQLFEFSLRYLKQQIHFHPICFILLGKEFTLRDLQKLYESILGKEFDKRNFCRKINGWGILKPAEMKSVEKNSCRKGRLFTFDEKKYFRIKEEGFRIEF